MEQHGAYWRANLEPLFRPASVAVIGASENGRGARIIDNLRLAGYPGKIFAVNPRHPSIKGLPAYPSILHIQEDIDAVTIQVPARSVPGVMSQCAEKKVKAVVINSAGFAETQNTEGIELQRQVVETAEHGKIPVCGPNCQGLFSISNRTPLYFVDLKTMGKNPKTGRAAVVSQSGSMLTTLFRAGTSYGVAFSHLISSGNEAILDVSNYLEYLLNDAQTKVIGLVLEGVRDPDNLRKVSAKAALLGKPIIVLKIGRSEKGRQSVLAHTSALAGSDSVQAAFFEQYGWVPTYDLDDLLTTIAAFARGELPQGRRLAIVGFSGGTTSLSADLCEEMRLDLPSLTDETAAKLKDNLRGFLAPKNPLDLGGPNPMWAETVGSCIGILGKTGDFDMAVLLSARGEETYVPVLEAGAKAAQSQRMAFAHLLSVSAPIAEELQNKAEEMNVPLLQDIRRGLQSIRHLIEYSEFKDRARRPDFASEERSIPPLACEMLKGKTILGEREAKKLLSLYGIPITPDGAASDLNDAIRLAGEIGYPVALKIDSPDVTHKSEVGGVRLGIRNSAELESAYRQIMDSVSRKAPSAAINGVLVQPMIGEHIELIVGMQRDPQFGPAILCGFGGVTAEILKDVSLRLCPLSACDADNMLAKLKGAGLLNGYRGAPPSDLRAVSDVLVKLSQLAVHFSAEIESIDINPLAVFSVGEGVRALDALIVMRQPPGKIN
ncbi:MAG: acetate--CoA ligase family protein [Candidatus Binatia bacterium]